MKTIILILFLIISASAINAQQSIEGKWQTGVDNTVIQTYQKNGDWFGKIVYSDNPKAKIGTDVMKNFKGNGNSWEGELYAPKKNKWLDAEITPSSGKLFIKVSSGLFSKNLEWTKAGD